MWRAHRGWTVIGLATAVVGGLLPNLMIVASGFLVGALPGAVRDGFDSAAGRRALLGLVLFGAASVTNAVVRAGFRLSIHQLSANYVPYVEDLLARATLAPDGVDRLEDPEVAGRISAVAEASRENFHLCGVDAFLNIVQTRATGLVSAGLLLAFHWWAPLVILVGLAVANWTYNRWVDVVFTDLFTLTSTDRRRAEYLRGLAVEPAAAKEIRVFGLADWVIHRFSATWLTAMRGAWQTRRRTSWPMVGGLVTLLAANVLVVGVLAAQAYGGDVSLGRITVFLQAVAQMAWYLGLVGNMGWVVGRAARTIQQIHRLGDDLIGGIGADGPMPPPATASTPAPAGPAAVSLRGLRFGYPGRPGLTLDGLTLDIPASQSVAVVGENGAGKSTLIKLLCGLYRPSAGGITIDGRQPVGVDLELVRRRVAVIFQDFLHYELPLRDNVGFGNLAGIADQQRLEQAMAAAGGTALAADVGWDTVLSAAYDGGTDLSGGQWQRVALARALAALDAGAGLLILDEPTAALDARAEVELFDRFLSVTAGVTTILVSHRLSSVRRADRIVVLADGHLVEDGSHAELMAAGGRYARMFTLQAERFTDHA